MGLLYLYLTFLECSVACVLFLRLPSIRCILFLLSDGNFTNYRLITILDLALQRISPCQAPLLVREEESPSPKLSYEGKLNFS